MSLGLIVKTSRILTARLLMGDRIPGAIPGAILMALINGQETVGNK